MLKIWYFTLQYFKCDAILSVDFCTFIGIHQVRNVECDPIWVGHFSNSKLLRNRACWNWKLEFFKQWTIPNYAISAQLKIGIIFDSIQYFKHNDWNCFNCAVFLFRRHKFKSIVIKVIWNVMLYTFRIDRKHFDDNVPLCHIFIVFGFFIDLTSIKIHHLVAIVSVVVSIQSVRNVFCLENARLLRSK